MCSVFKRVIYSTLFIVPLTLSGCANSEESQAADYVGSVTVEKTNGEVTLIKVFVPYDPKITIHLPEMELESRNQVDKLLVGLESLIKDLQYAKDQMTVVEPPIQKLPETSL